MSRDQAYDSELTAGRTEIAAALSGVADGILAGSVRLGEGDDAVTVDAPDEITLEIELETDDDEQSLELELEWPSPETGESTATPAEDLPGEEEAEEEAKPEADEEAEEGTEAKIEEEAGDEESPVPVGAADASQMLARFELFRDRADEWRWRLRHRNGNVIATSGEGYTRKHNARKGLRSVVQNAPEADVTEDLED